MFSKAETELRLVAQHSGQGGRPRGRFTRTPPPASAAGLAKRLQRPAKDQGRGDGFSLRIVSSPCVAVLCSAMNRIRRASSPATRVKTTSAVLADLPLHPLVSCQRGQREIEAVQVIIEVEDLGESGAGVEVFVPVAVGALVSVSQMQGALRRPGSSGPHGGHERHRAPGGLRGGASPLSFERRVVVALGRFRRRIRRASARSEPGGGFLDVRLGHVLADRCAGRSGSARCRRRKFTPQRPHQPPQGSCPWRMKSIARRTIG